MIEIEHLTKTYGDYKAVNDCTWTVRDGAITGFIGPNGAGKTTLMKMVTGVLKPTAGSVRLNGIDIAREPLRAKRQFGFVSDSPDHFLRLKGVEYLSFMADIYDMPQEGRKEFIEEYAERFGIADALNNNILSYSHGMRQKIMVMGALIHKPPVWILDEPLLGLDPRAAFELKRMMREHADAGNSVLFSTHVLEVAEKLCDQVAVIRKGEIRFTGTLEELKAGFAPDASLEDIFLQLTGERQQKEVPAEAEEA